MGEVILTMKDIDKSFPGVHALDHVNLEVRKGEVLALMGENGAGKSTLFRLMTCLETEYKGSITINGKTPKEATGTAAFMPQKDLLMPWRNILKNVTLPLEALPMSKAERISQAKEAIEKVGLSGCENKRPSELSGGMRQRVMIAMALAGEPRLIIADEPTTALDVTIQAQILELMQELREKLGMSIIMITHDANVASHAKKILHIIDGEIIENKQGGVL